MCEVIKRLLTPDFCSSHIQSGRTTRRSRMYSSTTRGRIHLLQFPHVHGIFPTDTNLLHYTPMEFDTETCNVTDTIWVKILAVLLLWFGLQCIWLEQTLQRSRRIMCSASQIISWFLPMLSAAPTYISYSHCLVSRAARDRVRYKVSAQSYLIIFLLKSWHTIHI